MGGFPGSSDAGDLGSIPDLERSPGKGNGNPLQYSCLKNSVGRGAWWAMGRKRVGHNSATTKCIWESLFSLQAIVVRVAF